MPNTATDSIYPQKQLLEQRPGHQVVYSNMATKRTDEFDKFSLYTYQNDNNMQSGTGGPFHELSNELISTILLFKTNFAP